MGVSKSFGTQKKGKNHLATCPHCFFGRAWDHVGKKGRNLADFGSKNHLGDWVKLLVLSHQGTNETPFLC